MNNSHSSLFGHDLALDSSVVGSFDLLLGLLHLVSSLANILNLASVLETNSLLLTNLASEEESVLFDSESLESASVQISVVVVPTLGISTRSNLVLLSLASVHVVALLSVDGLQSPSTYSSASFLGLVTASLLVISLSLDVALSNMSHNLLSLALTTNNRDVFVSALSVSVALFVSFVFLDNPFADSTFGALSSVPN